MESSGFSQFSFSVWAVLAIVLGVAIAYISFVMLCRAKTMPKFSEGFGAPVVGAGQPDCLHESNEAAAIVGRITAQQVADMAVDLEQSLTNDADHIVGFADMGCCRVGDHLA